MYLGGIDGRPLDPSGISAVDGGVISTSYRPAIENEASTSKAAAFCDPTARGDLVVARPAGDYPVEERDQGTIRQQVAPDGTWPTASLGTFNHAFAQPAACRFLING